MSQLYHKQSSPNVIQLPDGGIIEEHFGREVTGHQNISIARVTAPPHWSEPYQRPEFDEYTLMIRGRKMIEIGDEKIVVGAGESILVNRGTRVRYSNPFDEEVEYWTICLPAFSLEMVHREDDEG